MKTLDNGLLTRSNRLKWTKRLVRIHKNIGFTQYGIDTQTCLSCRCFGLLAVHHIFAEFNPKRRMGWRITHIPTGLAVANCASYLIARHLSEVLMAKYPDAFWSLTEREACERVPQKGFKSWLLRMARGEDAEDQSP